MLAFKAFLLPIALASPAIVVEGGADCPNPQGVTSELARIIVVPEIEGAAERATVSVADGALSVVLHGADGTVLGERRVPAEGTCEERARAVAVILAGWLTDVHPEFESKLPPAAPPAAAAAPSAVTAAKPAPGPPPNPPAASAPKTPAPSPAVDTRPSDERPSRRFSYAAAAGVELSGGRVTPAFALSSRLAPDGSGPGLLVFVVAPLPVERELGAGSVRSFRWPLGIGPLVRFRPGKAFIDVGIGPTVGWLHVEGEDFETNDGDDDAVLGAFLEARLMGGSGLVRPFINATLLGWISPSTVVAHTPEAEFDLPRFEALLLAGASFDP